MNFKVQILGSSSALPSYKRFSTAQIVTIYEQAFLIDCGEGTQIQLYRFNAKYGKIKNIFISHLHGDHFFGLFGLISSYNLTGRTKDLNIYAHQNLEKIFRTEYSIIHLDDLNFKIFFHHLPDNNSVIFENNKCLVESFPLKHSIDSCGFLFKEKKQAPNIIKEKILEYNLTIEQILDLKNNNDIIINNIKYKNSEFTKPSIEPRSYAFCTDTAYFEDIIPIIKNVDLLYHEATFLSTELDTALLTGHSTAQQAAEIAKKAEVSKLIIGHFSTRYKSKKIFLTEAQKIFENTLLAEDGMEIQIDKKHKVTVVEPKN